MQAWWRRGVAASGLVAVLLAGCGGGGPAEASTDVLACAAATETRVALARDDAAGDGGERAAAVLREVATAQFVLTVLVPDDPAVATARDLVVTTSDPLVAADAIAALSDTCDRADLPIVLEGGQHTTAACTQLRALDIDASADPDAVAPLRRAAFVLAYLERRSDDLDEPLADHVRDLARELDADAEPTSDAADRSRATLAAAAERCVELGGDAAAAPVSMRSDAGTLAPGRAA